MTTTGGSLGLAQWHARTRCLSFLLMVIRQLELAVLLQPKIDRLTY
jgi:hypothetical protein